MDVVIFVYFIIYDVFVLYWSDILFINVVCDWLLIIFNINIQIGMPKQRVYRISLVVRGGFPAKTTQKVFVS